MTEDQIRHMVNRFLGWKLPENFSPDGGISFKAVGNEGTPHAYRHEPTGTNLFDEIQAGAMVRYMIDGMPSHNTLKILGDALMKFAPDIGKELVKRWGDARSAGLDEFVAALRRARD